MGRGRVAIVHPFLAILGGGEFLSLVTAHSLVIEDFHVDLYTLTPVDSPSLERFSGLELSRISFKIIPLSETMEYNSIIKNLYDILWGSQAKKTKLLLSQELQPFVEDLIQRYEVVIDTQGDLLLPCDIVYLHYPWLAPTPSNSDPPDYTKIYDDIGKKILNKMKRSKILTNSSWTAAIIRKTYGLAADVLYPPVEVECIHSICRNIKKEKNLVITIARLAPDKRLESVIEIAKELKDLHFVIMGMTSIRDRRTLEELLSIADKLGNVEIVYDLPRRTLIEKLCRASIYLHPKYAEHFGISIVEAMAAGAVPVVYRSGGAWFDVVSRVSRVLGYRSTAEAVQVIRMLLKNRGEFKKLSKKAREIALKFDVSVYRRKMIGIVKKIRRIKRISRLLERT